MLDQSTFALFISRVRQGDQDAARELVRNFEGVIRREVRLRLNDPRLQRTFDSMDISQSVLGSFFLRAGSGQFEIETAEQLTGLLVRMTRNKLAFQVRLQRAKRRDAGKVEPLRVDDLAIASRGPGPSDVASDHDLMDAVRHRMDDEERQLADLRAEGWEWSEIAGRLGGSAQARRMQLARAIRRIARAFEQEGRHGQN